MLNIDKMKEFINNLLMMKCRYVKNIQYSDNPYKISMISYDN
jgi:hypothetical protein